MNNQLFLRGVLLVGFALVMFKLIVTGQIQQFIAPKMFPFLYFAMGVLFILGIFQIWRSDHHDHAVGCECGHHKDNHPLKTWMIYLLFIVPIITGLMFSSQVLDSSVAAKRGVQMGGGQKQSDPSANAQTQSLTESAQTEQQPAEKSIDKQQLAKKLKSAKKIEFTNENYLASLEIIHNHVQEFIGKEIQLTGFVYREPGFPKGEAVIARFAVTCCVADASVYGMLSNGEQLKELKPDEWVEVKGVIGQTTYEGNILPCINIKTVKKIQQPDEPYVYDRTPY
ncbi:TIGR03943 family putative permease subunit [Anoxybacteroides rupiense]|uniref:TIGR03943 family putative permease subunit n=1 Tax=Anoxybacteroides rupiense TaxID=311460 RepID=UPI001F096EAF|nr:TIGR03943 family protein [Anoxybacillus rupiensis]